MQIIVQKAPTAPGTPTAPAAAPTPRVIIEGSGGSQVISLPPARLTAADVAALKARRSELSSQLQSVDSRRGKLLSQLANTGDEVARKGLEDRIALLDKRQLQLESDIDETGRQLSSVPAGQIAATSDRSFFAPDSPAAPVLSGLFIVFVLGPLAFGVARTMWKRSTRPGPPPAIFNETAQRLERLEHSVDAIALEIERVSEGQRFVTKLLSGGQSALPAGAQRVPEPVRAGG